MQQDDSLYEVEQIIGKTRIKNKVLYKVHWKGYPVEQSTWEAQSHLRYVKDMVEQFEKQYKGHDSEEGGTVQSKDDPGEKDGQGECQVGARDDRLERTKSIRLKNQGGSQVYELRSKEWLYFQPRKVHTEIRPNTAIVHQQVSADKSQQYNETFIEHEPKQEKQDPNLTTQLPSPNNNELTEDQANKPEPKDIKADFRSQHRRARRSKFSLPSKRTRKLCKIAEKMDKTPQINLKTESTKLTKQDDSHTSPPRPHTQYNKIARTEETRLLQSYEEQPSLKIRILGDDPAKPNNDSRDYLVQYNIGTMKVLTTLEMMMTHPLEFVDYLQKKACPK